MEKKQKGSEMPRRVMHQGGKKRGAALNFHLAFGKDPKSPRTVVLREFRDHQKKFAPIAGRGDNRNDKADFKTPE